MGSHCFWSRLYKSLLGVWLKHPILFPIFFHNPGWFLNSERNIWHSGLYSYRSCSNQSMILDVVLNCLYFFKAQYWIFRNGPSNIWAILYGLIYIMVLIKALFLIRLEKTECLSASNGIPLNLEKCFTPCEKAMFSELSKPWGKKKKTRRSLDKWPYWVYRLPFPRRQKSVLIFNQNHNTSRCLEAPMILGNL